MIFDLSPCANCGHASAIHQVGSVCGAAHCKCRVFTVTTHDWTPFTKPDETDDRDAA